MKNKSNQWLNIWTNCSNNINSLFKPLHLPFCLLIVLCDLYGQTDTLSIDTIYISAGRVRTTYLTVPASVTQINLKDRNQNISHSSLQESVSEVPGLFALNGQNFAQDLRISIRGFGARSAFGIRGIKLLIDGIPETTPDGQGQLDNIAVSEVSSIEVLQGASAAQYGNAAGGVIELTTTDLEGDPGSEVSIRTGSYSLQHYRISSRLKFGRTRLYFGGDHMRSDGYREHSRVRQTNLLGKSKTTFSEHSSLTWQLSYLTSPTAEDPGGIHLEQATDFPASARDRNVLFDAGESIDHWKSSLKFDLSINPNLDLDISGFFSGRNFDGRLPFQNGGAIDLSRIYGGQMTQLIHTKITDTWINKLSFGFEYWSQRDDRERFENNEGIRGAQTLSQNERFKNFGIYLLDQWSGGDWTLKASLRYDNNDISIEDNFLSNGDDSGERKFNSFNQHLGLLRRLDGHAIFLNYSTSFETPLLSELSANPDGSGGFNASLEPMKARSVELGVKGLLKTVQYALTLFHIDSRDELLPFEIQDFPGRTFFRNAGKTRRTGLEAMLRYNGWKHFEISGIYSISNFTFEDYRVEGTDLSGFRLPGIPRHQFSSSLTFHPDPLFIRMSGQYFSSLFLTDTNDVRVDSYSIFNARMGYEMAVQDVAMNFYMGLNNIFSESYFDNVRLNAFGNRFYEPAARINIEAGVNLKF